MYLQLIDEKYFVKQKLNSGSKKLFNLRFVMRHIFGYSIHKHNVWKTNTLNCFQSISSFIVSEDLYEKH